MNLNTSRTERILAGVVLAAVGILTSIDLEAVMDKIQSIPGSMYIAGAAMILFVVSACTIVGRME